MEIKKLINIVVNDMQELEKFIAEIREGGEFNYLEMEILQTKARGIKQLLDILKGRMEEDTAQGSIPAGNPDPGSEKPETKENEEKEEESSSSAAGIPGREKHSNTDTDVSQEPEDHSGQKEPETETSGGKNDSVELQEPEEDEKNGKVLGEKFMKSKSLNDLISGNSKFEYKLSERPVNSIRAAIGINDRFLFTRELFDGDSELYTKAVTKLDNLQNINEAVAYLRENFKWKKNETSLKFIDLVKRRFLHD